MDIILYKTEDSENTINKTLTNALTINVNFKASLNIEAPEIILLKMPTVDYSLFNYAHIPDLNRYYFIRSESKINFNIVSLQFEPDYLESFKTEILTAEGSYSKVLEVGDYGELDLNENGKKQVVYVESDLELVDESDKILTVLRWS